METTTNPIATTPAPFGDDDPRAVFGRAVALGSAVIGAVTADQLDRPTPCDGMAVRDLLAHLVMVVDRVAAAGRADDPWGWPTHDPAVARSDHPTAALSAFRTAAHEVQAAWTDDAILDRPTRLPWDTMSGREVLGLYTNEVTVHTWDLARATGQRPAWDETVLAAADAAIHDKLPDADRAPMWEQARSALPEGVPWEDPFGPAVEVRADAPLIDRLVAWNGRQP